MFLHVKALMQGIHESRQVRLSRIARANENRKRPQVHARLGDWAEVFNVQAIFAGEGAAGVLRIHGYLSDGVEE